ncbi:MAG: CPBP family intramembrane metalloprotease [Candidatus Melainabacteria bacterium HGW-Melainabacteria-1]|nr:MAG: CPBP family intramembrane metalloprotease [Candidatus Melainabacteria bacterium HGW-Melainabacteria-1]
MDRDKLIDLITVQNLVLLILCFGWLWLFPNPNLWAQIRIGPELWLALPAAALLLTAGALGIRWIPALRNAQLYLDRELFRHLRPRDLVQVGLLAGVAEELCFRGLLQSAWGLIPASLCFGLLHLPGFQHWAYAVWATLMGLCLGLIYLYFDNLLLVMLIHAGNNSLALLLWPKLRSGFETQS